MKRTGKCPKCSSPDIIVDAKVIDSIEGTKMSIATFRMPQTLFFRGKLASEVSAWVCARCGFVELYADSPSDIKQAEV